MKILYCAPNLHIEDEWCALIGEKLKNMGHNVLTFDYRAWYNPNNVLEKLSKSFNLDLLFVVKGEMLSQFVIKSFKCKKFLWDEANFQVGINEKLAREFDYVASPAEDLIPVYEKLGCKSFWINYTFESDIYKPISGVTKKYDLTFVGTYYKERADLLDRAGLMNKIQLYGNGWENIGKRRPRISMDKLVRLFSESKIILNMHQESMKKHKVKANMRIVEALGAGCFILTDYCPGLEELFVDGKDLVVYDGVDDLKNKIDYYLDIKNDLERELIASNGHLKASQFNIGNTLKRIFEGIEA